MKDKSFTGENYESHKPVSHFNRSYGMYYNAASFSAISAVLKKDTKTYLIFWQCTPTFHHCHAHCVLSERNGTYGRKSRSSRNDICTACRGAPQVETQYPAFHPERNGCVHAVSTGRFSNLTRDSAFYDQVSSVTDLKDLIGI